MPYRALPVAFASQFEASGGGGDGVGERGKRPAISSVLSGPVNITDG